MPPQNSILRKGRDIAAKLPPVINAYRKLRDFAKRDPVITAAYQKIFERRRLRLPTIAPEQVAPEISSVSLPVFHPLFAGEDAPLADLLFILNVAKARQARRILEVGTYRARTTFAFHINCPEAHIISYDIQILDSRYRQELKGVSHVELRHGSFVESAERLRREPLFDLIFVDGSHYLKDVLEDSALALELVAPGGVVLWHDYRYNGHATPALRVPEALNVLRRDYRVNAVQGTTCAVWIKD